MFKIRKPVNLGVLVIIIFLLTSCYSVDSQQNSSLETEKQGEDTDSINRDEENNNDRLTIDEIKKQYTDSKILSIHKIDDRFVLIESQKETFANVFELYDLDSGDKDIMPTMAEYVSLKEMIDENNFIFLSSGKNSESSIGVFPYLIKFSRVKSDINSTDDFIEISEEKYFGLNESISSGSKGDCSILSDIIVTLGSIQVLFEPIPGQEAGFYAADSDIPKTTTIYSEETREMVVEMEVSEISNQLEEGKIDTQKNDYVDFIKVEKSNKVIKLILGISPEAEKYMMEKKRISKGVYFEISF